MAGVIVVVGVGVSVQAAVGQLSSAAGQDAVELHGMTITFYLLT